MKKLQYGKKFLRDKNGKVTIDGIEYSDITMVPADILDDVWTYLIKESKDVFKMAKPFKVLEKIGWGLIYLSAGAAIASWCVDGQAAEVFKQINLYALAASGPELIAATAHKVGRVSKANRIQEILGVISDAQIEKRFQRWREETVGNKGSGQDDNTIEVTEFAEIN